MEYRSSFLEADDPVALTAEQKAQWEDVDGKLNAAWGNSDFAYQRSVVPTEVSSEPFRMTVWKGERASALIVLWSGKAKKGVECKIGDFKADGAQLPSSIASAHFVRYTLGDQQTAEFMKTHRYRKGETPAMLVPDMLDSLSSFYMAIHHSEVSQEDIDMRREQGFYTTFYVCCHPSFPNTFSCSQPYESELLGWYNVAQDYDGMLRWAYNSWAADPQYDSRFGKWISGDTYFVYPFNRSSVRFEKLIDGIEVAEKVRQLRKEGVDVSDLEASLKNIRDPKITDYTLPWHETLQKARQALDEVSR